MSYIAVHLRTAVIIRANYSCEYCLVHADYVMFVHEVDHVIAQKQGGATTSQNLAYACGVCNRNKGSDIASIDPETGNPTFLYNPRTQVWDEHFQLDGALTVPLTAIGRATVRLLQLNQTDRLLLRRELLSTGRYPYQFGWLE
jgi:hypothetical protein